MAPKKRQSRDFLSQYLNREDSRSIRERSKHAVDSDKWDREDLQSVLDELPEAAKSDEKLASFTNTGHHAWGDNFFGLVKASPETLPPEDVEPQFLVNRHIHQEAAGLKETEELRQHTQGDPIASALASITMEETLETLFDKFKEEQKLADKLQQQQDQMDGLDQQERDLDEMLKEWMENGGDPNDQSAQEPRDFQQQQEQIERNRQKLQQQMDKGMQELQDKLDGKKGQAAAAMRKATQEATEQAQDIETAAMMWGQDPGTLHSLDAKKRLEFAKKVQSAKFKKLAQLIGPLTRLALAEQSRKTEHGRDEIHDISLGSDLSRLVPTELMYLDDEHLELDFFRRLTENQLLQYELRGVEKVAKGGIIFCADNSGSMSGDREIWCKAVGGALLHIARKQKRSFYGIHFGSPGQIKCFDFRDPKVIDPDGVMAFMSEFFGGGTDFVTPFSKAVDLLREEFDATGAVKGDIVFATDGMCGVPNDWMESFIEERDRLGFRVFGINIGGHRQDEPLYSLADHRVCTVMDLMTGGDVRDLFREI